MKWTKVLCNAIFIQDIRHFIFWDSGNVVWAKFSRVQAVYGHKDKVPWIHETFWILMAKMVGSLKQTHSCYCSWEGPKSTCQEQPRPRRNRLQDFSLVFLGLSQDSHPVSFMDHVLTVLHILYLIFHLTEPFCIALVIWNSLSSPGWPQTFNRPLVQLRKPCASTPTLIFCHLSQ